MPRRPSRSWSLVGLLFCLAWSAAAAEGLAAQQLRPILGSVVDEVGALVADADVYGVYRLPGQVDGATEREVAAKTDSRGRFVLKVPPYDRYLIWAIGPESDEGEAAVARMRYAFADTRVTLKLDRRTSRRTIQVEGLDEWRQRGPFRLRFSASNYVLPMEPVALDEADRCVVPPLPTPQRWVDVLCADGSALWTAALWTDHYAGANVLVNVPKPFDFRFRSVDGRGRAVPGAKVEGVLVAGFDQWGYSSSAGLKQVLTEAGRRTNQRFLRFDVGVTDGNGQLFARLPSWRDPHKNKDPLRVVFWAQKRGHQLTRSGFDGLPFYDSKKLREVVDEVRFTMDPCPERRFRLRLSDTEGAAGVRVRLREKVWLRGTSGGSSPTELVTTVTTDEQGEFTVPQRRGTSLQNDAGISIVPLSTALRDRFLPASAGFPASPSGVLLQRREPSGEGPYNVELSRLRRVDLRLTKSDGSPASSAVLVIRSQRGNGRKDYLTRALYSARADVAGRISVLVETGPWSVLVLSEREAAYRALKVSQHATESIELSSLRPLQVAAVRPDGKPVRDVSVYLGVRDMGPRADPFLHELLTCIEGIASRAPFSADGRGTLWLFDAAGTDHVLQLQSADRTSSEMIVIDRQPSVTLTVPYPAK